MINFQLFFQLSLEKWRGRSRGNEPRVPLQLKDFVPSHIVVHRIYDEGVISIQESSAYNVSLITHQ